MESQLNYLESELNEKLEVVVLPELYGVHEECIHKIPLRLQQLNPKAYTPHVVSIGPLHNPFYGSVFEDNNVLKPMKEIKLSYFKGFLNRTKLRVEELLSKLEEQESRIRSCYAGGLISSYHSYYFLKVIIIDACFIVEHFHRNYKFSEWKGKDPLLLSKSLFSDIQRDLILLENQLPFFVLEEIYNLTPTESLSFVQVTFHYFKDLNFQEIEPLGVCPKHLTDLIRILFLPPHFKGDTPKYEIGQVYSASQLLEAGLVFKAGGSHCLLDLNFEKGVLTMPFFIMQDKTEVYLRNILAYEEYDYPSSALISQYMVFLDDLINTEKDVNILVDKKILRNLMGDANSVATSVNNLSKNLYFKGFDSKLLSICHRLNGFYENPVNKYKTNFIHECLNTPVKIASTIAAVSLLFLTLIQTIFSVWSFLKQ